MKFAKLLTGVAVATMMAGAAHGQAQIVLSNDDANNMPAITLASERLFNTANPTSGTIEFALADAAGAGTTQPLFGAGGALSGRAATDDVDLTITLTGDMTFSSNLSNINYVGGTANCVWTIQSGGVSGSKTVTYRLDGDGTNSAANCVQGTAGADTGVQFRLPVNITGAANFGYALTLAQTGAQLASATFDTDYSTTAVTGYVRTSQGYNPEFSGNTGTVAIDLQATPAYTAFDGATVIGSVRIEDASAATGPAADFAGVLFSADNAGTQVTDAAEAAQLNAGVLTVTLPEPAGIASATLAGIGTQTVTSGVATFTLSQANVAALAASADLSLTAATGASAAAIANQTPALNLTVSGPTAARLTVPAEAENGARLVREGSNSTSFEWVGDSSGSATNVWRFTGISPTNVPTIRATLSGASAGSSFNKEYVVTPANAVSPGGELVITTADLQSGVGGNWGRANVSFSVEASGVSVRRFILGSNGTLTTFDGDFDIDCNVTAGVGAGVGAQTAGQDALSCTQ